MIFIAVFYLQFIDIFGFSTNDPASSLALILIVLK